MSDVVSVLCLTAVNLSLRPAARGATCAHPFFFPKSFGHDAVDGLFVSACGCSQKRTDAVRKAVRTFRLVWAESERLDIFWFLASQERPFVSRWAAT